MRNRAILATYLYHGLRAAELPISFQETSKIVKASLT